MIATPPLRGDSAPRPSMCAAHDDRETARRYGAAAALLSCSSYPAAACCRTSLAALDKLQRGVIALGRPEKNAIRLLVRRLEEEGAAIESMADEIQ